MTLMLADWKYHAFYDIQALNGMGETTDAGCFTSLSACVACSRVAWCDPQYPPDPSRVVVVERYVLQSAWHLQARNEGCLATVIRENQFALQSTVSTNITFTDH